MPFQNNWEGGGRYRDVRCPPVYNLGKQQEFYFYQSSKSENPVLADIMETFLPVATCGPPKLFFIPDVVSVQDELS